MAKQNKIQMPSSGGGLMLHSGDDDSNIRVTPKLAAIVIAGLTFLIAVAQGLLG